MIEILEKIINNKLFGCALIVFWCLAVLLTFITLGAVAYKIIFVW